MKWSIIILAAMLVLFLLCRFVMRKRIKDVIRSSSLRFFIGFVIVATILFLNRYSLLALPVLIHSGYTFADAMKNAFAMSNDLPFFIGLMLSLCEEMAIAVPKYLSSSLENILAGETDIVNTIGDLFELVLLIW